METINGLHIELASEKLKGVLSDKAKYHREKTAWYKEKADGMNEEVTDADDTFSNFKYASNNPTQSLRQSQTTHLKKARFFELLVDNIIPNSIYRLSQENCVLIELYERY